MELYRYVRRTNGIDDSEPDISTPTTNKGTNINDINKANDDKIMKLIRQDRNITIRRIAEQL